MGMPRSSTAAGALLLVFLTMKLSWHVIQAKSFLADEVDNKGNNQNADVSAPAVQFYLIKTVAEDARLPLSETNEESRGHQGQDYARCSGKCDCKKRKRSIHVNVCCACNGIETEKISMENYF